MNILYFLLIGLAAGWLAGKISRGEGFGLGQNLIIGVIGSILGGFAFGLLQIKAMGLLGELVTATVGALILLFLLKKLKSKS
ncbi:MAG: GlsB/YeaQ/YmgE family stress response membrane protein [Planctomycetaceae bacterium]